LRHASGQPFTFATLLAFSFALWYVTERAIHEGMMDRETQPEFIESTAGQVAAELARRGISPDQRVTITIEPDEPDDWIAKARKFARPKVIAEGWTDADIDRVIKEERGAVQSAPE
jgi:hypothetical protein